MKEKPSALERGRSFATYMPRTIQQVEKKLAAEGYTQAEIAEVLLRLQEERYLDDTAYTEMWIHGWITRNPMGRALIRKKLQERGVDRTIINAELMKQLPEEKEEELAITLAQKKLKTLTGARSTSQKAARVGQFLTSRGFSEGVVWAVLSAVNLLQE